MTANIQGNRTQALGWDVFVTPGIPVVTPHLPPGITQAYFQAIAATLIYGERDAVLVDAFMTVKQVIALADWGAAKGKNLTAIYITHGHGAQPRFHQRAAEIQAYGTVVFIAHSSGSRATANTEIELRRCPAYILKWIRWARIQQLGAAE